jgi:hypothetical protein
MCDRYVLAFSGNVVEFDRASYLMDRDLLDQTIRAMRHEQTTCPRWDAVLRRAMGVGLLLRASPGTLRQELRGRC